MLRQQPRAQTSTMMPNLNRCRGEGGIKGWCLLVSYVHTYEKRHKNSTITTPTVNTTTYEKRHKTQRSPHPQVNTKHRAQCNEQEKKGRQKRKRLEFTRTSGLDSTLKSGQSRRETRGGGGNAVLFANSRTLIMCTRRKGDSSARQRTRRRKTIPGTSFIPGDPFVPTCVAWLLTLPLLQTCTTQSGEPASRPPMHYSVPEMKRSHS